MTTKPLEKHIDRGERGGKGDRGGRKMKGTETWWDGKKGGRDGEVEVRYMDIDRRGRERGDKGIYGEKGRRKR
jgi:hypothetical protein